MGVGCVQSVVPVLSEAATTSAGVSPGAHPLFDGGQKKLVDVSQLKQDIVQLMLEVHVWPLGHGTTGAFDEHAFPDPPLPLAMVQV